MVIVKKKGKAGGASKRAMKRKPVEELEVEDFSDDDNAFVISDGEPVDEKKADLYEDSSDGEGHDSDRELQIALRDGLLKSDRLNYMVEKKRPIINKTAEIQEKIAEYSKKLPWIETLDVTTSSTLTKEMINDDFEREMQFYKQAEKAVQIAVPRLLSMGVKVLRPSDYYAEMAKSDGHMQKVRKRLLDIQEGKERQEAIRRMREEKKYATKVQKQVIDNKNAEKKKLMEAVKKHKKGMKQQLEDMLNNVKRMGMHEEDDDDGAAAGSSRAGGSRGGRGGPMQSGRGPMQPGRGGIRSRNFKAEFKSEKFGYGGKKKGTKRNNKESFEDIMSGGGGGAKFGGPRAGFSQRGGRGRAGGRGKGRR